jgi:hypothetical protein
VQSLFVGLDVPSARAPYVSEREMDHLAPAVDAWAFATLSVTRWLSHAGEELVTMTPTADQRGGSGRRWESIFDRTLESCPSSVAEPGLVGWRVVVAELRSLRAKGVAWSQVGATGSGLPFEHGRRPQPLPFGVRLEIEEGDLGQRWRVHMECGGLGSGAVG